jgi:hypothetical protein
LTKKKNESKSKVTEINGCGMEGEREGEKTRENKNVKLVLN